MKKIIALSLLFCALNAESQVIVNQKDISQIPDVHYLRVSLSANGFKSTYKAYVEYGQTESVLNSQIEESLTSDKSKAFNSDIDMFNFLAKNGFELLQIIEKSSEMKKTTPSNPTSPEQKINKFEYVFKKIK
jgi:hypothetical protein